MVEGGEVSFELKLSESSRLMVGLEVKHDADADPNNDLVHVFSDGLYIEFKDQNIQQL